VVPKSTLAVGVVAIVAAVAAAVWAVSARSSGSAGGLVYAQPLDFSGRHAEIYVAAADGSHARKLTDGTDPVISPDGRAVAFVRPRELLVIPVYGGFERSLIREGRSVSNVAWARDSSKLVAVDWDGPSSTGSLFLIDLPSGRVKTIARADRIHGGIADAGFSPDGKQIVYAKPTPTSSDLFVYTLKSGSTRQITRSAIALAPTWGSPGIAYYNGNAGAHGDVWLIRPDGTGAHRLTHTNENIFPAAWSADGTRLLAANPAMHNGRLWAVSVPGGQARRLSGWVGDLFPQDLSRDGSTVLAAIGCGGHISPYGTLETLPFAGGKPTVIAKGPCRASWNR
jgi:Tol biopolymer transport system component